ncbi:hypothetical protein AMK17_34770 [Streptomyces sp. CB00072]|nr:hypothetical protein AMK17_34770 [Streptomyces sp. CB00072]
MPGRAHGARIRAAPAPETLGTGPIPSLLAHLRQADQGVGIAVFGSLLGQGFRSFPVPGLLAHPSQDDQGVGIGGLLGQSFRPLPVP